jgi:toxin ParE1/3/4
LKIEFSGTAKQDLLSIRHYIAQDNGKAAERVVLRILQSIRHLGTFPELGREWSTKGTRALSIPGLPYRVHYQQSGEAIEILTIVHTSRQLPKSRDVTLRLEGHATLNTKIFEAPPSCPGAPAPTLFIR